MGQKAKGSSSGLRFRAETKTRKRMVTRCAVASLDDCYDVCLSACWRPTPHKHNKNNEVKEEKKKKKPRQSHKWLFEGEDQGLNDAAIKYKRGHRRVLEIKEKGGWGRRRSSRLSYTRKDRWKQGKSRR